MNCVFRITPKSSSLDGSPPLCGVILITPASLQKVEGDSAYTECVRPQCGHECPIYQWSKMTTSKDLEQGVNFIDAYERATLTECFVEGHASAG